MLKNHSVQCGLKVSFYGVLGLRIILFFQNILIYIKNFFFQHDDVRSHSFFTPY